MCSSLREITLSDSVTDIRDKAFAFCASLTSVTVPNGVTCLGAYAFEGCSTLTDITIPVSVQSIDFMAFSSCDVLQTVHYGGSPIDRVNMEIERENEALLNAAWVYHGAANAGDANGDGSVDMKDVLMMRKFIANRTATIDKTAADVNRDSSMDMKDVLLVRKFIAGIIESFA